MLAVEANLVTRCGDPVIEKQEELLHVREFVEQSKLMVMMMMLTMMKSFDWKIRTD